MNCNFCAAPATTVYPVPKFLFEQLPDDGTGWAACLDCKARIEARNTEELTKSLTETYLAKHPETESTLGQVVAFMRYVVARFYGSLEAPARTIH